MTTPILDRTPAQLRDDLQQELVRDLVGPYAGPDEELERVRERPTERYLLGMLAPREDPAATADDTPAGPAEDAEATAAIPLADDPLGVDGLATVDGEDGQPEASAHRQMVPSSFGFTCTVEVTCGELDVRATWGRYRRTESEQRVDDDDQPLRIWRRTPAGGRPITVPLDTDGPVGPFSADDEQEDVVVRGLVRSRGGYRHVSLFLVNGQSPPDLNRDEAWLLQAELSAAAPDGSPVFCRRSLGTEHLGPEDDRNELAGLDLQYRDAVELAVGHGIGVHVQAAAGDPKRATRIVTTATPSAEVPLTETPTADDYADVPEIAEPLGRAEVDMRTLSTTSTSDLLGMLDPLVQAYEAWIDRERRRLAAESDLEPHREAGERHLAACIEAAGRIRDGIDVLKADEDVADAFRFANHVMWQQRIHSIAAADRRKAGSRLALSKAVEGADISKNRRWRAFQLAFVLMNLPSLADPRHLERSRDGASVDLLFFPTGGGKTEAYLGLTAFTLAIRRLQGTVEGLDGRHGVAVLMRYTLRLLTLQQFQRAAALMCACEIRRRELRAGGDRRWDGSPFRIGLWVGQASTPTRTEQAREWVSAKKNKRPTPQVGTPVQLSSCPWCGETVGVNDVTVDTARGRTIVSCGDSYGACPFTLRGSGGEGLPVVVVDEEVYRLLPSLVIATVDKFARMPWVGSSAALFGRVAARCERHGFLTPDDTADDGDHPQRSHQKQGVNAAASVVDHGRLRPPDLVVQDELHLITGPLGSMVGLYETAIDDLASWVVGGATVRPKVIASTATIRRADRQVEQLFARDVRVFPPPALDARDNFFALQRDRPEDVEERPGRRYMGVCAPGRRFKGVLVRVYLAQLRAAWSLAKEHPGETTDAYLTLVGYFNSLRELGGMRRMVDDDVQSALLRVARDRGRLEVQELTSRQSADRIPQTLDQLAVEHQVPRQRGKDRTWPVDVVLATNMLSVGVDVPRLGAMVVAGQPKATSEYIQATSRVGRAAGRPGLVITVYNWSRPRDLSHYETFEHFHRTFYRQVEALSVTPFAARALTRGLTGVVASMARLGEPDWNRNRAAGTVGSGDARSTRIVEQIGARAERTTHDPHAATGARDRAESQIDRWQEQAMVPHRTLTYRRRGGTDGQVSLLREPGVERWDRWTVPTSLRNVEAPIGLRLDLRTPAGGGDSYPAIGRPDGDER